MRLRNAIVTFALTIGYALALASGAYGSDDSLDRRTFVTLHVNTVDEGEAVVVLRAPDILVPVDILKTSGVHGFKGTRVSFNGKEYVSLSSLAPDVKFSFDINALKLDLTVAPRKLGSVSKDLARARPAGIAYKSNKNAYLNYALTDASGGYASAFFDGAFNHGQDGLHYSFTEQRGSPFRRGLIYYQMDDRRSTIRRIVGDLPVETGDLGAAAYIAGFGIARDFGLDPYAVNFPLPSLAGLAATPSTADIYVNGVLVQRVQLPPGSFNLNHLPVTSGSANTSVVVTDAFGRSQTYSQNFYTSAQLLKPHLTDYQFAAGLLRQDPFQNGDRYGPPVATARYRVGVSDALTVGGRFEATTQGFSAGPTADFKIPIGYVHVAASASRQNALGGAALSIGYGYAAPRFAFNLSLLSQGPYYSSVGQSPYVDRATSAVSASASWELRNGDAVAIQYFRRHMRDSGTSDTLAITDSLPVRRGIALVIGAERDRASNASPTIALTTTLNFTLGRRTTVSAAQRTGSTQDSSVEVAQSPNSLYGFGYSATYDPSYYHAFNGTMTYRSTYGDASLDVSNLHGYPSNESLRLSGGIVAIDRGLYATRPVTESFALVQVPGVGHVPVYLENQQVGRTDARGNLLVPNLLPNFGNDVRIDDKGVSIDTDIQSLQTLVAPPQQSGAVVRFEAQHLHALRGRMLVMLAGAPVVPKYGELTLHDASGAASGDSALGNDGQFYLENVKPGAYDATVEYAKGTCAFTFTAPPDGNPIVDMGVVTCTQR